MPTQRWATGCGVLGLIMAGALALGGCDREDPIIANGANGSSAPAAPSTPTAPGTAASKPISKASSPAPEFTSGFTDVTGPVKPEKVTAQMIQTLAVFNHPWSCAVSLDRKSLFVTNSAITSNGFLYGKGSVSKLSIGEDGRLTMEKLDLVTGLHAPQGIAVLPRATGLFPAGSVFISTGTTGGCDEKDQRITEIKRFNAGVTVVDPGSGKVLGFIPMGEGHALAKSIFHAVLAPAGLCFDAEGNLYVADSGNTGKYLEPEVIGRPGVVRIFNRDLDGFSQDKSEGRAGYLPVMHIPSAVYYSAGEDAIYWTTSDGQQGAGGAVFRTPRANFPEQTMVSPVVGDLGALMGVCITPQGSLIASRVDGDLALVTRRVLGQVEFSDAGSFSSPGDIKLLSVRAGYNVLYVPEQEPFGSASWKQRLRVVLLPSAM